MSIGIKYLIMRVNIIITIITSIMVFPEQSTEDSQGEYVMYFI